MITIRVGITRTIKEPHKKKRIEWGQAQVFQINFEREQWTTNFPEIFKAVQTEIKERCPGYDIAGFVLLPEEEKILSKKQGGKHHENDDKILSLLRKKNTT